jgi:hypothetical protein
MSPAEWLEQREPVAPAALTARLLVALGAPRGAAAPMEDRLFAAAEVLFHRLLREGCANRAAAQDLLAADALVTYAFEAASEGQPSLLEERAAAAMRRIATLGLAHSA